MSAQSQIREAVSKVAVENHEHAKATPRDVKIAFLQSRGWVKRNNRDDKYGSMWERIDNPGWAISLTCAYGIETRKANSERREQAIKDGTARICCHKCKADLQKWDTDVDGNRFSVGYYGLVDAKCSGGFNSEQLSDGGIYRFSLCEKCLMEMFETFAMLPDVDCYL